MYLCTVIGYWVISSSAGFDQFLFSGQFCRYLSVADGNNATLSCFYPFHCLTTSWTFPLQYLPQWTSACHSCIRGFYGGAWWPNEEPRGVAHRRVSAVCFYLFGWMMYKRRQVKLLSPNHGRNLFAMAWICTRRSRYPNSIITFGFAVCRPNGCDRFSTAYRIILIGNKRSLTCSYIS